MGKNRVQSGAGRSEQGITEILGLHGGQGHGREGGRAGGDRGGGCGGCPPSTSGTCAGQSAQGGNVIEALVARHRNLCGLYSEYEFCYLNCPVFKFMNCKSCTSSTCCL